MCSQLAPLKARPSGRQDSNLRPLVPQTSPYFSIRSEIDLERFSREVVGMTTRARVMESAGIAENRSALFDRDPRPSIEPPAFLRTDARLSNVSVKLGQTLRAKFDLAYAATDLCDPYHGRGVEELDGVDASPTDRRRVSRRRGLWTRSHSTSSNSLNSPLR
jgi:hypothetical protein